MTRFWDTKKFFNKDLYLVKDLSHFLTDVMRNKKNISEESDKKLKTFYFVSAKCYYRRANTETQFCKIGLLPIPIRESPFL